MKVSDVKNYEGCQHCDAPITNGGTWGLCPKCAEFVFEHERQHVRHKGNKACDLPINQKLQEVDRQGIHTKTYPNGATYRGYYLNDKRHGAGIKTHADGKRVHCVYEHGVKVDGNESP